MVASLALDILAMSFEADLNVLALSDTNVTGSPLLLVNRRKASMKAAELSLFVNSKCTALVEAYVNKHTYALASSSFAPISEVYRVQRSQHQYA